jgi:dinuclear metal center YbgI/SA1388 family protein
MKQKNTLTINEILAELESFAPLAYQESYDNSGLLVGDRNNSIQTALLTLDCTEAVVDEAIQIGAGLIIAHHPILFSGLKSLTGKTYIERVLLKAIKNDIAIYACHTNLDNIMDGVNRKLAEKLNLKDLKILEPRSGILYKLYVYVPKEAENSVRDSLFKAGAGKIGHYEECSFNIDGNGTFKPLEDANPYLGSANQFENTQETKIEVIVPKHRLHEIKQAMKNAHPYEEVAYGYIPLENENHYIGSGMIGLLEVPKSEQDFLHDLKKQLHLTSIRHTEFTHKPIQRVAICGGSGSFLLKNAIYQGADAFITADFKYHQFFDTEGRLLLADIGHYESEQYTPEIFYDILSKKFHNFAFRLSSVNTNPIHYF